jgi:hypothetical protein
MGNSMVYDIDDDQEQNLHSHLHSCALRDRAA